MIKVLVLDSFEIRKVILSNQKTSTPFRADVFYIVFFFFKNCCDLMHDR